MRGKTWLILVPAVALVLVIALAAPALADWPLYRRDAANTGLGDGAAPAGADLLFSTGGLEVRDGSGVSVCDGIAYLFTANDTYPPDPDLDSKVAAVNALDGSLIWERELEFAGYMGSWANPVCDGGRVYIGCGTSVYALDEKTGEPAWSTPLPSVGGIEPLVNHTPLVAGGRVYVGDYNSGMMYGLDCEDGSIDWQYDMGEGASVQGSPAYVDGWVICTRSASFGNPPMGRVDCVSAADPSQVAWTFETEYDVPGSPSVDVENGLVYFSDFAYGGNQSFLYCVRLSDGSQVWKKPVWGTSGSPSLDGKGRVYMAGNDSNTGTNHVYCFDAADGDQLWDTPGWGAYNGSVALTADGKVVAGSMAPDWKHSAGIAVLRGDTGAVIWSTTGDGGGNPVVSSGVIYTTGEGELHAYADYDMTDWYFAEGYTGDGFEEWLTLANFDDHAAPVNVTYVFSDAEPLVKQYTVGAQRRLTLYVNAEVGPGKEVSIYVQAGGKVVAERPMYFSYAGTGGWGWKGGHDTAAVNEPLQEWYFAEGYTGPYFEEWLCLANFNDGFAGVTVTYIYPDRDPKVVEYQLPPHRRVTLNVNNEAGAGVDVSISVHSDRPVVAERPMYFNYKGVWDGGHVINGVDPADIE